MRVLGLISGTSHDGIDAAVVDFTTSGGFTAHGVDLHGAVLAATSVPYDPRTAARLIAALPPAQTTLAEVAELDTLIGQAFADVAADIAAEVDGVDAVCSHGQTVYHWSTGAHARAPCRSGSRPGSPRRSAPRWSPTSASRDITVGGHGAPLVSFLDELLLRSRAGVSAALNLGGISNMTVVRQDGLVAYDIGPANALVDAVILEHGLNPLGYDDDAAIARTGQVTTMRCWQPCSKTRTTALTPPKSTGKEHFHLGYVHEHPRRTGSGDRGSPMSCAP